MLILYGAREMRAEYEVPFLLEVVDLVFNRSWHGIFILLIHFKLRFQIGETFIEILESVECLPYFLQVI